MSFYLFLIWSKRGCVSKSALEMPKKGFFSENVRETTRKRGAILSCGTIMCFTFYLKVTTPGL